MCKRNGETTYHLLIHCPIAQELWNMVCSLFGVCWVLPRGVVDLLASGLVKFHRHRTKVLWIMIRHCLMWVIWRVRNLHTLKGVKS